MRHGSCRIVNNARIVCANPAMFDHSFVSSSTPFEAYLPLDIEEIVDVDNKILISSCLQILKKLVITYRNCRKAISITFYLEDAVSFCFPMKCMEKYFHVIYCSKKTEKNGFGFGKSYIGVPIENGRRRGRAFVYRFDRV